MWSFHLPQRHINLLAPLYDNIKKILPTREADLSFRCLGFVMGLDNILPAWLIFILQDPIFSLQFLHRSEPIQSDLYPWSEITLLDCLVAKAHRQIKAFLPGRTFQGPRDNLQVAKGNDHNSIWVKLILHCLGANRFRILIFYFLIDHFCIMKIFDLLVWY